MTPRMRFAAFCLAATLVPVLAGGQAASLETVTVTIRNDASEPLRCTAVLAHFMSEALGTIAPGGRLTLALRRERASGTLALAPRQGRDVPLENILCGRDAAWTASKADLPLPAIRGGTAERFEARCALSAGRAACTLHAARR